jgi:hypothetical protein
MATTADTAIRQTHSIDRFFNINPRSFCQHFPYGRLIALFLWQCTLIYVSAKGVAHFAPRSCNRLDGSQLNGCFPVQILCERGATYSP